MHAETPLESLEKQLAGVVSGIAEISTSIDKVDDTEEKEQFVVKFASELIKSTLVGVRSVQKYCESSPLKPVLPSKLKSKAKKISEYVEEILESPLPNPTDRYSVEYKVVTDNPSDEPQGYHSYSATNNVNANKEDEPQGYQSYSATNDVNANKEDEPQGDQSYLATNNVNANKEAIAPSPKEETSSSSDEETGSTQLKYFEANRKFMKGLREFNPVDDVEFKEDFFLDSRKKMSLEEYLQIANEFQETASVYAKMIVTEKHLPRKRKKIQPENKENGVAGGTKFKIHDMFFKFPEDKKISSSWIYGGYHKNDRLAGKATNHELKGMNHLMNADIQRKFNYPLILLIDYQGLRQTILTEIPIDGSKTLIYGSSDGGTTIQSSENIHQYLLSPEVSQKLNLKEHLVKGKSYLALCGDIEIHNIQTETEQEYFVLDYARILPPTTPEPFSTSIFFRLLRPEMLRSLSFPVSSDSYSLFQTHMSDSSAANNATTYLLEFIEQKFSSRTEIDNFLSDEDIEYVKSAEPNFSSLQPKDYFTRKLHQNGINIRYLGKLVVHLEKCKQFYVEDLEKQEFEKKVVFLISLMYIRIFKNYWRDEIIKENSVGVSISKFLGIVENIFNPDSQDPNWKKSINQLMKDMFVININEEELFKILTKFQDQINYHYITLRFCQMCGIGLNEVTISSLRKRIKINFTSSNISHFYPILRTPPIISYFNTLYYICSAKQSPCVSNKIQFYKHSILHIEYTLGFQFKTKYFRKLHDYVSFALLKYNRRYPVHWSNLLETAEDYKSFETFSEISSEVFEIWEFLQSPITNRLNQPIVFQPSGILKGLTSNYDFESFGRIFQKQCCEYAFEKEQFLNNYDKTKKKENKKKWNDALNMSVREFIGILNFEKGLQLNLEEVQYWDIDEEKKNIFLFMNQFFLFEIGRSISSNYDLFGMYPLAKAFIFDLCFFSKNEGFNEMEYLKYVLRMYVKNKIEDVLFENLLKNWKFSDPFQEFNQVFLLLLLKEILSSECNATGCTKYLNTSVSSINFEKEKISNKRLKELTELLKRDSTITSINFSGTKMNDIGAQYISDMLKSNSTITSLDLSDNNIGKEGVQSIVENLKFNSIITSIDLSKNEINKEEKESRVAIMEQMKSYTIIKIDIKDENQEGEDLSTSMQSIKINNRFKLLKQIGKGEKSTVYKGMDMTNATFVAIKQLRLDGISPDNNDWKRLQSIHHPNIISFLDSSYIDNHMFLVLEYVENGSLAEMTKELGQFPEHISVTYIPQILDALGYLHSQGFVHKGIRASNILLTNQGSVKISSCRVSSSSSPNEELYWTAPEIIERKSEETSKSDIWSVGCTLIELLSGNPPYFELDQKTIAISIVQDDYPPLPEDITPLCKDFLSQCFQKEPYLRPTTAQLMTHPWFRVFSKAQSYTPVDLKNQVTDYAKLRHKRNFRRREQEDTGNRAPGIPTLSTPQHGNASTRRGRNYDLGYEARSPRGFISGGSSDSLNYRHKEEKVQRHHNQPSSRASPSSRNKPPKKEHRKH